MWWMVMTKVISPSRAAVEQWRNIENRGNQMRTYKYENKTKSEGGKRLKSGKNTVSEASRHRLVLQKMLFIFQWLIKKSPAEVLLFLRNRMLRVAKYHIRKEKDFRKDADARKQ